MTRARAVCLKKEAYDVYAGRRGHNEEGLLGNPIRPGSRCFICGNYHVTGTATLPCFREWFVAEVDRNSEFKKYVLSCRGKRLGCFCRSARICHAGIIADYINSYFGDQNDPTPSDPTPSDSDPTPSG